MSATRLLCEKCGYPQCYCECHCPTEDPQEEAKRLGEMAERIAARYKALADPGPIYLEVTAAVQDAGGNPLADEVAERLLREPNQALLAKIEQQGQRIAYLEGATNHATGTPLSVTTKALQDAVRIMNGDLTQPLTRILEARAVCLEALKRLHK